MRLVHRFRLPAGLILLLACLPIQGAMAHAQLLFTNPADNAVLAAAPETIVLSFNEPVTPLAIRLIRPSSTPLNLLDESTGGAATTVSLPTGLDFGTYALSWRVVSADGHPIGGSLVFSIGQISASLAVEDTGDISVSVLLWLSKAAMFVALFAGVGGAAFGTLAPLPPASRKISMGLAILGMIIVPMTLGLQGLDALSVPLQSIFDGGVWHAGMATSYGATAIAVMAAFALAAWALSTMASRMQASAGIAAAGLAALSLALSGHASAASPQWITRPAVFVHIAGLLFWLGALLPLGISLRGKTPTADHALALFSRGIPFAVGPLTLSGLILAFVQMGWPGPHWVTAYGFILAAKLILLCMLFGLATWNRLWLTKPALAGNSAAQHHLRRSIAVELLLVVTILTLVAGWRFTPPPRAVDGRPSAASVQPIVAHLIEGDTMAMVTIAPGSAGPVELSVAVSDIQHSPKDAQGVAVMLANPELGIEPIRRNAYAVEGLWRVDDLVIPAAGTWHVEVEIRLSRFALARPSGEVLVP